MNQKEFNVGDMVVFTGWGCCRGKVSTVVEVRKRRLVVEDESGYCCTVPKSKCSTVWRCRLTDGIMRVKKGENMKYVFEFLLAVVIFLIATVISFGAHLLLYGFFFKLFCWVTGLVSFNLIGPGIVAFIVTCVKVNKDNIFDKSMELAEKIVEG